MLFERVTLAACAALVAGLLAACDESSEAAENGEAEQVEGWTFRVPASREAIDLGDRLPASPELTALVPATSLFPGATAVIPDIPNPYGGQADAVSAGERHFAAFNCAGCHAALGGGGMGPPLGDDDWIYGGAPAQIFLSIIHGRGDGMPAFGGMLPQKTVWELVAYVETLSEIEDAAKVLGFEPRGPRGEVGGAASSNGEDGGR